MKGGQDMRKISIISIGLGVLFAVLSTFGLSWGASPPTMLMVVRGMDGALYKMTCDDVSCSGWVKIPGKLRDAPSVTWDDKAQEWVIVGVNAENKIYVGTFDKAGKFNEDWHQIIPGASPVGAGLSGMSIDTLRSLSCSNGQVAKWSGSVWACSDVGTSPHTHAGSDITSGIVSVSWIDSAIARDSEVDSSISTHTANASAHHVRYTDGEAVAAIKNADGSGSLLDADLLDGQHASAFASSDQVYTKAEVDSLLSALQSRIAALEDKLSGLTRSGTDFVITNANLYIQSGSGKTDGETNGKGNLIIGYNELRGESYDNVRTGSHNLIVGRWHNHSSYGGVVLGEWNTISGYVATVTGGRFNTASGAYSSVSGGTVNTAYGDISSVSGGGGNTASGEYSSVSGGQANIASGAYSSVSGGQLNTAAGSWASTSGGYDRDAPNQHDWRGGGLIQDY